ncbi:N-formylglutamate amidohydrolase (plasmid) [Variovorax sp. 375MFSha3.1]|uniref:N-formylglutamate amidohydrolase n=1 Tax=unclassified Variovorax TaxID=663243 RepID=UPI003AAF5E26
MSASSAPSYILFRPSASEIPLVCESPYSGTRYPDDFGHAVSRALLRSAEDKHVESLWSELIRVGGTLVATTFPRSYIDPNRKLDDIDPLMLASPWPYAINPSEKSQTGRGLLWSAVGKGASIYDRKLSVAEVKHRIDTCYRPYHTAVVTAVKCTCARFGVAWHLNLHSMPSDAYERLRLNRSHKFVDFVLSDHYGATCEPQFVDIVKSELRRKGYSVVRNDTFKGAELARQFRKERMRSNSLQIVVRRSLYMDERSLKRIEGFKALQMDLGSVARSIAEYLRDHALCSPERRVLRC